MLLTGGSTPVLVPAEGRHFEVILETEHRIAPEGLSRRAFQTMHEARIQTLWGTRHDGGMHSSMETSPRQRDGLRSHRHARWPVIRVLGMAASAAIPPVRPIAHTARWSPVGRCRERTGADLALLWSTPGSEPLVSEGFESIPMLDVELTVSHSVRHGAPMTLVRAVKTVTGRHRRDGGGSCRTVSVSPDRDVDYVKVRHHEKTPARRRRSTWHARVQFVIAEEGIRPPRTSCSASLVGRGILRGVLASRSLRRARRRAPAGTDRTPNRRTATRYPRMAAVRFLAATGHDPFSPPSPETLLVRR